MRTTRWLVELISITSVCLVVVEFNYGSRLRVSVVCHGLLYTRPDILPTENRVGYFDTICNQTKLLSVFSSMSRIRGKDFTFFEKILGEIWASPTFWF